MPIVPLVIPRAFAVQCVLRGSWPKPPTSNSLLISIVDSATVEDDLAYSAWSYGHWVDSFADAVRASGISSTLSLHFSDICPKQHVEKTVLFTDDHAADIIQAVTCRERDQIYVHCAAGVSRSGAVGEFIQRYHNVDYQQFKATNPNIKPNPHVLSTLMRVSGLRAQQEKTYSDVFQ